MIKNVLLRLFQWRPSQEALIPTIAGFIVLALSAAMIPSREAPWVSIMIRDIGLILMVGIIFPLNYILRSGDDFAEFGLTLRRWYIVFPINFMLGALLLLLFLSEKPPVGFSFDTLTLARVTYILLAVLILAVVIWTWKNAKAKALRTSPNSG